MVAFIAFETVDVSVTVAAASMVLRMVVARPAVRRSRPVVAELRDVEEVDDEPFGEVCRRVDDGIVWPKAVAQGTDPRGHLASPSLRLSVGAGAPLAVSDTGV
jgi:hypothetical protein